MEISKLLELLHKYMDKNYVEKKQRHSNLFRKSRASMRKGAPASEVSEKQTDYSEEAHAEPVFYGAASFGEPGYQEASMDFGSDINSRPDSFRLRDYLNTNYSSVSVGQKLNLYMYERDITTKMIYERCFIDRKLISKITKDNYHPSKRTMLLLCIGLQLSVEEGEEFLRLAGYSFTNNDRTDLIIHFALELSCFDLDEINAMLYEYNLKCIGA